MKVPHFAPDLSRASRTASRLGWLTHAAALPDLAAIGAQRRAIPVVVPAAIRLMHLTPGAGPGGYGGWRCRHQAAGRAQPKHRPRFVARLVSSDTLRTVFAPAWGGRKALNVQTAQK